MAKLKDYDETAADFLKRRLNPKPKTSPEPAQDNSRKPIIEAGSGDLIGYDYADGRVALKKGSVSNNALDEKGKPVSSEAPVVPKSAQPTDLKTESLISQVGQLTPEQQALAKSNPSLPGTPSVGNILKTAGERAAIGAAGGAVTGAALGTAIPGAGTLAGAGLGAVGAGLVGGVTAIFTEYKKTGAANLKTASNNYDFAITNMEQAITLANKGAGYETNSLAVKNFNRAQAQIDLAESQLKELSRKNPGDAAIREKLTEIQDYRINDKPRLDLDMVRALQKPTVSYVNEGVSNGRN